MSVQTHISDSCNSEYTVQELRFAGTPGPTERSGSGHSLVGSVVPTSVLNEDPVVDDQIAIEKCRFNQQARVIEETAAHEVALAAAFVAELKMDFPNDAKELDDCLAAETVEIHARAATQRQAEIQKFRTRVWEIHNGREPLN
ncbi:hypothetical protein RSAG8_08521, partial [Rhizoctonia solani AG-8 WAC10335]